MLKEENKTTCFYDSTFSTRKRKIYRVVVLIVVVIIFPYALLGIPLSFLFQKIFPRILQPKRFWECELVLVALILMFSILVAAFDGLVLNKVLEKSLSIGWRFS